MSDKSGNSVAPAGWYPDNEGNTRWWDGSAWTEHVHGPRAAESTAAQTQPPAQPQMPKSSRPWYRKKRWGFAAAVIVVIVGASAASGGGNDVDPAADKSPHQSSDAGTRSPAGTAAEKAAATKAVEDAKIAEAAAVRKAAEDARAAEAASLARQQAAKAAIVAKQQAARAAKAAAAKKARQAKAVAEKRRQEAAAIQAKADEKAAQQAAQQDVYYANCTEVENAGAAPIYAGDPGYSTDLDRDQDGSACDQ